MVAAAIAPSWGCVKDFSLYICRKRRDALDLRQNFDTLKLQVNRLMEKWNELDDEIERLSITVERSLQYVSTKQSVSMIQNRFNAIDDRYQQLCVSCCYQSPRPGQKTCEMMLTWKLFAFARLHTKVGALKSDASEANDLLKREELINQVRPFVIEIPYSKKVDIAGHPHKEYLDRVLNYIDEEDFKTICVYGTVPGVGVSNIMKNVNNYFVNPSTRSTIKSKFAFVIWVAIQKQETSAKTVEVIQKEILFRLSAPAGETRQQNSQIITSRLGEKKCLLLLDDFPADIMLEDIGIPEGKVVLTTKDIRGLRINQGSDAEIEVKKLLPVESNYMFELIFFEKPGQKLLSELERDEVDLILKYTDGILAYIKVAAKQLDNPRNLEYWQGVRQALQSDVGHDFLKTAGIRNLYKKAYDKLDEDCKKCVLYVALYPNEYVIPCSYLIECWKAQNFLRDYPIFKAMRTRGKFVCVTLEQEGLLERACEKSVKMPQMVRKVAITLPYPDQGGGSFVRFHAEDERVRKPWSSDAKWICGVQTKMEKLPVSERCESLLALLLQKNSQLIYVEIAFFASIPNILVLDMHGTGIKLLPTSISSLTKLRCLYLNGCRSLERLPEEMVHLADLEVFDIRRTPIQCKPVEIISRLLGLKCLRISFEKEEEIWEIHSRSWCCRLEELGIEFSKGVEKGTVDLVEQELELGFRDSDKIKISLESEFGSKELLLKKKLEHTTDSPSTSGVVKSITNNQSPDPMGNNSIELADRSVSRRGKEIVKDEVRETVPIGLTEEASTSSKPLSDSEASQKGKEIIGPGITDMSAGEIVEEESNGNPDKGLGSGLKKECD